MLARVQVAAQIRPLQTLSKRAKSTRVHASYAERTKLARSALQHAVTCDAVCQQLWRLGYTTNYSDEFVTAYQECRKTAIVAWDIVEEVYAALADCRTTDPVDPLEQFCAEAPDSPECLIYDV